MYFIVFLLLIQRKIARNEQQRPCYIYKAHKIANAMGYLNGFILELLNDLSDKCVQNLQKYFVSKSIIIIYVTSMVGICKTRSSPFVWTLDLYIVLLSYLWNSLPIA